MVWLMFSLYNVDGWVGIPRDFAGVNGTYIILCLFILIIIYSYHVFVLFWFIL